MKKFKLFFLVLVSLLITSCSSNDDSPQKEDLLVGEWKTAPTIEENNSVVSGPIHFVWDAPDDLTIGIFPISKITQIATDFDADFSDLLKSLIFTEDGNILVNYCWADSLESLDSGYFTFKRVKSTMNGDFRMLVFYNINKIKDSFPKHLLMFVPDLKTMITNGIPVNYRFEGNRCVVYLDKEFISELVDLIVKYKDLICEYMPKDNELYTDIAKMIIENLPKTLNETKNLEIGFNLTK